MEQVLVVFSLEKDVVSSSVAKLTHCPINVAGHVQPVEHASHGGEHVMLAGYTASFR